MAYQFTQTGSEIQDILDLAQLQIAAPYDAGTSYTAGMYCTKDDGFYVANASTSGTWDGSKWTAVTVGDVLAKLNSGYTEDLSPAVVSVSSGTWTAVYTRSFAAGKYLVVGGVAFDTNSTGYRAIDFAPSSASAHGRLSPLVGASSSQTRLQVVRLVNFSASVSYSLWAYQNSGSAVDVYPSIGFIRLA